MNESNVGESGVVIKGVRVQLLWPKLLLTALCLSALVVVSDETGAALQKRADEESAQAEVWKHTPLGRMVIIDPANKDAPRSLGSRAEAKQVALETQRTHENLASDFRSILDVVQRIALGASSAAYCMWLVLPFALFIDPAPKAVAWFGDFAYQTVGPVTFAAIASHAIKLIVA